MSKPSSDYRSRELDLDSLTIAESVAAIRHGGIDYDWSPVTFWADAESDVLEALLRNVQGRNRRQMIRDYWAAGRAHELDDGLLEPVLRDQLRESLGRIHPSFMGGEYLPGYRPGEEEIARIELESTTADVVSLRARPAARGRRIAYRVVDEDDTKFIPGRKTSAKPMTLDGVIRLIDGAHPDQGHAWGATGGGASAAGGPVLGDLERRATEVDAESLRTFFRVTSDVYHDLEDHYARSIDRLLAHLG